MFFLLLGAFVSGVIFVFLVEIAVVYKWFKNQPNEELKELPSYKPVKNPEVK